MEASPGGSPNLEKVAARRVEPRRVGPDVWGPEGWGAQNFVLFFPSPATIFFLSSLFFGVLSWNFGGV